ncbi:MAG: cysteine--tRNA ligase, partial [Pseudomonadota bacterium]
MTIRLYDSLAREKRDFEPQDPNRVTMYVCGPTVYNRAHIGNFRPVIVFDTLFRVLRDQYGDAAVVYARNVTDIEDKIITASQETGETIDEITKKYAKIYDEDAAAVNALPPTIVPWATDHVDEMLDIIETLERKGYAYETDAGVFFNVPQMEEYGQLSKRKLDDNQAGARVDVDLGKRDPSDFALWKFAKPDEPEEAIW